jgi:hypothetical protein
MGPRLFGIPATEAPVVAVLRRGPSDWFHLGRWDVEAGTFEPGAWLRGTVYPQRCDLSPDGRLFVYFTLKASASWAPGPTYIAVSRLPWLTALAAWGTGGTWTRGLAFVERGAAAYPPGPPDTGALEPLLQRYALDHRRPASFAVERARGWTETADSPPHTAADPWDDVRIPRVTMEKARPGDASVLLRVRGRYAAHRGFGPDHDPARYALRVGSGDERPIEGVQWADWARDGRLLVATIDGRLEVRDDPTRPEPAWTVDLAPFTPDPAPPPAVAAEW